MTHPALLLTNSDAGTATEERITAVEAVLRDARDVTRRTCDDPTDLHDVLRRFDGDTVIVCGGDGSLHTLVNVLHDLDRLTDTTVGIVPLGTANDFAAGLGLPDDPVEAAKVCASGHATPTDALVTDDGEVVVNAAHAGIGAVASERARPLKPLTGALAYPLAALLTGATTAGQLVTVEIDDDVVHEGPALLTLVANGPSLGGQALLCPTADPRDGLLDLLVIGDVAIAARAALARDVQRGELTARDDVVGHRGHIVRIRGEAIDHSRDGELRHDIADATYRVRPGAWRVLHP
ncbi:MAG TPA: YegS/Rv2252/BmrU family lipid kinase [Euzebyales bacterium]